MRFLFIDWLDSLVAWQPPGAPIDGVCRSCEDSWMREMGVLSVLPHDLLHEFVTDVSVQLAAHTHALGDRLEAERVIHKEVAAILPEVAEIWEQHASPRLRAWTATNFEDPDGLELETLLLGPHQPEPTSR